LAYIISGAGQAAEGKAAAPARTTKRARKGRRPSVAGKSKKGAKRFVCWKCARPMSKKGLLCKRCKAHPAAAKSQIATLNKAHGGQVRPVRAAPVTKAARPRCPNPACGKRAVSATDNCCRSCGWAYSTMHAAVAQKSADGYLAAVPHTAEWWEARAAAQWNPADREECYAAARRAREAAGQQDAYTARQLMKASGARSLEEAYRMQTDPRAQEIIHKLLYGGGRRP
jgi:hypothetical protein